MLEQRRAQQKGYITLREAAAMSNYTPDYVGQLIRAGKIKGEQVYCNVAWVTTPEEITAYMERRQLGSTTVSLPWYGQSLFKTLFSYCLYTLIIGLAGSILFLQYVFVSSLASERNATPVESLSVSSSL